KLFRGRSSENSRSRRFISVILSASRWKSELRKLSSGAKKPGSDSPFRTTVLGQSAAYVAKWVSDPGFSATCYRPHRPEYRLPAISECESRSACRSIRRANIAGEFCISAPVDVCATEREMCARTSVSLQDLPHDR